MKEWIKELKGWGFHNLPDQVYTDALCKFVDNKLKPAVQSQIDQAVAREREAITKKLLKAGKEYNELEYTMFVQFLDDLPDIINSIREEK